MIYRRFIRSVCVPFLGALGFLVAVLTGCGGGDSGDKTTGPDSGSSPLTAVIDGQSWAADPISIAARVAGAGGFVIVGSHAPAGGSLVSISISLYNIKEPGTYQLGVLPSIFGGVASVGEGGESWITPLTGSAGTITLTVLTPTRIAGTFAYTAEPGHQDPGAGIRTVGQGQFDLPLTSSGTLPTVPDYAGCKVAALVDGVPYAASNAFSTLSGSAGFGFSSSDGSRGLSITLDGVIAPGTYPISVMLPLRSVYVHETTGAPPLAGWGLTATDTGTVTVTSLTATRARGTFSVTLGPAPNTPAASPITVANGVFDVGIQ